MLDINYFYDFADKNKIKIIECDLGQAKGLCIYDSKKCNIYINNNINGVEKKCVLAEEIAHFSKGIIKTEIFNNSYNNVLNRSINECRAVKWMIQNLIPFSILKQFIGKDMTKYDIAQELEVTEELVEKAYHIYESNFKGCVFYEEKN